MQTEVTVRAYGLRYDWREVVNWDVALGMAIGGVAVFFLMSLVMVNARHPAPKPPALHPTNEQRTLYKAVYVWRPPVKK